jgi:ABC-type transport system involved in multi-copper enzyme maturation permease subunit
MINILRQQMYRLKKSSLFWTLFALSGGYVILNLLFNLTTAATTQSSGLSLLEILRMIDSTTERLAELDYYASIPTIFAILCSSILLSQEFSQGTIRNTLITGVSRTEVFFAYLITSYIIGLSCMLINFVAILAIAAPILQFGSLTAAEITTTIFCHFAIGVCATLFTQSLVCMLLFCSRKSSVTISLSLVTCLVIIPFLTGMEAVIVGLKAVENGISETGLLCLPFVNLSEIDVNKPAGLAMGMACLYYIVLAVVFCVAGYFTFRKADLK